MPEVYGNTLGLKASELRVLRNTYRRRTSPHEIVNPDLARHLSEISKSINRQVGVLMNRKGDVENVVVGDAHKLELPDIGRARAGQVRLRGLRLVHAHLVPQNGDGQYWRTETLASVHGTQPDVLETVSALEDELARRASAQRVSG